MGERLVTITKQFTFHAAHRLPNHDGPCRDMHGHSYLLEVAVTGLVNGPTGDSDEGMVLDFGVLKDVYQLHIEPKCEHKYLNDTLEDYMPKTKGGTWGDPGEPITSSENVATWIHDVFQDELDVGPTLHLREVKITLWETPTSYVEVGSAWRNK